MLKPYALCVVLFVLATGLTHADIYRCGDADGSVIFTDNPLNLPPGCQAEVVSDLPRKGVSTSSPSSSVKQSTAIQRSVTTTKQKPPENGDRVYDSLRDEAEALIERFDLTRRLVFRSTKVKNKQKARRELKEIRTQKSRLLSEVDQSALTHSQEKEIKETLSSITN